MGIGEMRFWPNGKGRIGILAKWDWRIGIWRNGTHPKIRIVSEDKQSQTQKST